MIITVQRENFDDQSTQGEMLLDGVHFAYTLEPRKDQSRGKPYCVPAGTYQVLLNWSDHFSMIVPAVMGVPDFTGVEIHPGNFPGDTHGCCLIGTVNSKDFVGQSRVAFEMLMSRMEGNKGASTTITYIG
jgi:Family of unknown function (DUF5675)